MLSSCADSFHIDADAGVGAGAGADADASPVKKIPTVISHSFRTRMRFPISGLDEYATRGAARKNRRKAG
jgi:hypothetical protein